MPSCLLPGTVMCPPWLLSLCPSQSPTCLPHITLLSLGHRLSSAHPLTPSPHCPCSPHALCGRRAWDRGLQLVPPPQPDLLPSLRRRQEDAQTEESKSVLQDDGEDPDGRKDKCTWEGDGKKATQRERRKWGWGKGKHERARTGTHICTLPGRHGQACRGWDASRRCPHCNSPLGPWSLSRTDPSWAARTCQGETQGPWDFRTSHRPLPKLPFGVPVRATAAGYLRKLKALFNFLFWKSFPIQLILQNPTN